MSIEQEEIEDVLAEVTETADPEETEEEVTEEVEEEATEEVTEEATEEEKPKKKKKTMEERRAELNKSTWEMREAERKSNEAAARAQEQADRVEQALRALEEKQAATEHTSSRPVSENFESHEDYQDAVMDWKIKGSKKSEVKPAAAQSAQSTMDYTDWNEAREDAISKHKDFAENEDKVLYAITSRVNYSAPKATQEKQVAEAKQITDIIIDSKVGTKLVQHLGKNPEKMREISRLSPMKAAMELGKLEDRMLNPPKKKSTTAPKPVTKVVGSGGAASLKAKNTADWMAQRNEEVMKKRKG